MSNILYAPKVANLGFCNLGSILPSEVQQLHFITDKCKSEDLRGGVFAHFVVEIKDSKVYCINRVHCSGELVVSIGRLTAFYVALVPLELPITITDIYGLVQSPN